MDMDGRYGLGQIFQRSQELYLDHQQPGQDPGRMGVVLIPLFTFIGVGAALGMVALPLWVAGGSGMVLVVYAVAWALAVATALVYAVRRRERLRVEQARLEEDRRRRDAERAARRSAEPRGARMSRARRIHDPDADAQPPPAAGR